MKTIPIIASVLLLGTGRPAAAQTNTASNSGSIGKCSVWDYPYTLYNTSGASQTINNGVTVTVDQNRNIGAVNLTGSGAMEMNGANGITLSGAGSEMSCRWDIPYSHTDQLSGSDPVTVRFSAPVFTAPYSSTYRWLRGSGWNVTLTGSYLTGFLNASVNQTTAWQKIYSRNEAGSCGLISSPAVPATWTDGLQITMNSGDQLSYAASVAYSSSSACNHTSMGYTLGNATLLLEN